MVTLIVTVAVVSAALLMGAVWGVYGRMSAHLEGFLIALAGGALIVSVVAELIQPAIEQSTLPVVFLAVAAGAGTYTFFAWLIAKKAGNDSGGGLLAAITLDGIPENVALGIALIGAGFTEVAALAGAIFLSNLPEAAGGAKEMADGGHRKARIMGIWALTAVLLSVAAVASNMAMSLVSDDFLAAMQGFAAGAVVSSLATTVFPKAFREDNYMSGIAVAIGLVLALALGELGG